MANAADSSSSHSSINLQDALPEFVSLEDKYTCSICHNVLVDPMQTECGHRLCRACAETLLQEGRVVTQCPAGEEDCLPVTKDSVRQDFSAKREIKKLAVYCKYKENGCKKTILWSNLQKHSESCDYAPAECPHQTFGCQALVLRNSVESHVEDCSFKPQVCPNCNVHMSAASLEGHLESHCPNVTTACPYNCGENSIERGQLDHHTERCANKPAECKYKPLGCLFSGESQEMTEHEGRDTAKHLDIMATNFAEMLLKNSQFREELLALLNSYDRLKNEMGQRLKDTDILKELLQSQDKRVGDFQIKMVGFLERLIKLEDSSIRAPLKEEVQQHAKEIVDLKHQQQGHDTRIRTLERSRQSGGAGTSFETQQQIQSHDHQLGIIDVRLAENNLRFQCLETASYDGVLIWKISEYKRRKQEAAAGRTPSLYSQPFYTSRFGYKLCARVYLNGDGMGRGTHISLFFVVLRGDYDALLPWPFQQKVTLTLLDQDMGRKHLSDMFRPDPTSTSFRRPTSEMNIASGCPLFVPHSTAESRTYLKSDTIFIKITVDTDGLTGP